MALAVVLLSGGIASAPAEAQDMPAARSAAVHPYASHVAGAARRFGIPEAWIWAVIRVESGGNARAVSRAGAMGLMQIMPATWGALRARYGLGPDPFDVRDNIMAGAAYLREMHDRYGNASAMLAAYNAGPGRYDDFVSRGRPLPAETVGYLAQLAPITGGSGAVQVAASVPPDPSAWRRAALFVRTGSAASDAVGVQSGSGETAPETLSGSVETNDGRTTDPSPNVARHAVRVPRPRGPTAMIRLLPPSSVRSNIVAGEGENGRDRRGQDTRRTPFRRKAEAFPWLHMGAWVGERAARKEKGSNINTSSGTIRRSQRKAARP